MQQIGHEHTSVGVELSVVEVANNILDGLDVAVPSELLASPRCFAGTHGLSGNIHLEVSSDKELTSHVCGCGGRIDLLGVGV
jgi:hypothetical protein